MTAFAIFARTARRPASRDEALQDLWLLLVLLALVALFATLIGPRFLSLPVLRSVAVQLPELGILSLAMMVALLSGGINLSVVASAVFAGIVTALVVTRMLPDGEVPVLGVVLAMAAGIAAATATGLASGVLVAFVGVSPILATLGTMTVLQGANLLLTGGRSISGMPASLRAVGEASVIGVPAPLLLFAATAAAVALLLRRTAFGLAVVMMGSNPEATRLAGVDTRRVLVKVYGLSGLLAGIAGVLMLARFNSINSGFGESYLLVTILAAVLGGVDPFGGFGRVRGLVLALVVLQVVSTGLNMLHASAHVTLALWGGLLVLVMGARMMIARGRA
jgi:simple sugar transport system permease protein